MTGSDLPEQLPADQREQLVAGLRERFAADLSEAEAADDIYQARWIPSRMWRETLFIFLSGARAVLPAGADPLPAAGRPPVS